MMFVLIFTIYKIYGMILCDYFVLMKLGFFQYYYPETESVMTGRKYGFNIRFNIIPVYIALTPFRVGGTINWSAAVMFAGFLILV